MDFNYDTAFSRNIGWVTQSEQKFLETRKVAIAGLGGVGGSHLVTLTRLGIGGFNIADFDQFDLANFNRQAGANTKTIGRKKLDVMAKQALDINPNLNINRFKQGIREEDIEAFLDGVDLYVDGLDFFVLDIRRKVFKACHDKGIPAITAAPLGMGTSFLAFLPGKMSFEEYFRFEGQEQTEQYVRFLVGLSPAMLQMSYLVDPSAADFHNKKGPSTIMGCTLASGVIGSMALKILLNRGTVPAAPHSLHFDAYRNKLSKTWRIGGNSHPLQKIILSIARKKLSQNIQTTKTQPLERGNFENMSVVEKILNRARWAPSGDNSQPWSFRIQNETEFTITINIDAENPYEFNQGQPTITSAGMLLETIKIAASSFSLRLDYKTKHSENTLLVHCCLVPDETVNTDPLLPFIEIRSTNRKSYRLQQLTEHQIQKIELSLDPALKIQWHLTPKERINFALLNAYATDIRLRIKECYHVHKEILSWSDQNSESQVPIATVGLDPITQAIMRWAMQSWKRVDLMNRLTGTFIPTLQMDILPGIRSSGFFSIHHTSVKKLDTEKLLKLSQSLQRFWLTATSLGLVIQPGFAPLCFFHKSNQNDETLQNISPKRIARLRAKIQSVIDNNNENAVFLGRIGHPIKFTPAIRSVRKPLSELIYE